MKNSLIDRLNDFAGDGTAPINEICAEALEEIERLRNAGRHFADWIEEIYGSLPTSQPPGPPRALLLGMRRVFQQIRSE